MNIFITGTDTNIGKTVVSSWLCLHLGYDYFKPVQTGSVEGMDSNIVSMFTKNTKIHKESYVFKNPLSPHMAAEDESAVIDLQQIKLPQTEKLIIEGAGGLLVPINDDYFISDLISHFNVPVILVARPSLGTINHTLLSLEHMRNKNIEILGVILSGEKNLRNRESIEKYGDVEVLAELPYIENVCAESLKEIPLTPILKNYLR